MVALGVSGHHQGVSAVEGARLVGGGVEGEPGGLVGQGVDVFFGVHVGRQKLQVKLSRLHYQLLEITCQSPATITLLTNLWLMEYLYNFLMNKLYRPIIIAHRGNCSAMPENVIEGFIAGMGRCHYLELDIMLSKDNKVIVFHDRNLSLRTNIAQFPQWADRKHVMQYDKTAYEDWWAPEFTLDELRQLNVVQYFPKRQHFHQKTHHFVIPTFEETIEAMLKFKKDQDPTDKTGLLVEIKHEVELEDANYSPEWEDKMNKRDEILVDETIKILHKHGLASKQGCDERKFPVTLQSFSHNIMKKLNQSDLKLPLVHLFEAYHGPITSQFIDKMLFPRSIGIGIPHELMTPQTMAVCHQRNLAVYYWTLRDDIQDSYPHFKGQAERCKSSREVYEHLLSLRLDGFITEFPENCSKWIQLYKQKHGLE